METNDCTPSKVFYKEDFEEKVESLQKHIHENGVEDLLVVADFDLTLTAPAAEQCHHMFGSTPVLPASFKQQIQRYLNFEVQCTLDEWWIGVHDILLSQRLTRDQIVEVVREAHAPFREGAVDFLNLLNEYNIPVVIISAGVTDMIVSFLEMHGVMHPNTYVASNKMVFDPNNVLVGFEDHPYITSRNKELAISRFFGSLAWTRDSRKHSVIAVGDKPHDVTFLKKYEELDSEHFLTLGFRDREFYALEEYLEAFDVTCIENQSFALCNDLLKKILTSPPSS